MRRCAAPSSSSRSRGDYTLVVVEHDMDFVARIADRVTVLHEGRVLAEGSMQHVQQRRSR